MNTYESTSYLIGLREQLLEFLPNLISDAKINPKIERQIIETYKPIYLLQLKAASIVGDIEISHLLGMNEVVVNPLISEYRALNEVLVEINKELNKMKKFQLLQSYIPKYDAAFTKKCLYDDLTSLKNKFNLTFEVKEVMA